MPCNRFVILLLALLTLLSCKEETPPKPKAMLRLDYSRPDYTDLQQGRYSFRVNSKALQQRSKTGGLTLEYPEMKGSIFITYKPVENNLKELLADAQKLSYEHVAKADNILEQPFVNSDEGVYGMFYEVRGDAASQAQFYVTDSSAHFVTGSLYFMAIPNYDSIYPAAIYLQRDIRTIMETLKWEKD